MGRLAALLLSAFSLCAATDPARDFAGRVAAALGPQDTISLNVRGLTPDIPGAEISGLRAALEEELRSRIAQSAPASTVQVTVAQNQEGYVWVAEIRRGDETKTLIGSRPQPDTPEQPDADTPFTIEKKLIWEQQDPVLDLILKENVLAVLEPSRLSLYQRQEGRWQRRQSLAFPDDFFAPRDPRGRLELAGDALNAMLPGVQCAAKLDPASSAVDCRQTGTLLAKGRNFFAGPPPAFSSAALDGTTLVAGLDGRVRLGAQTLAGWGSDFALITTACGSGRQVLATSAAEDGEADTVQAYVIAGQQATAVSAPLELSGAVTALWPAADGTALAVVRNIKTGRYAAYTLSLSCPR